MRCTKRAGSFEGPEGIRLGPGLWPERGMAVARGALAKGSGGGADSHWSTREVGGCGCFSEKEKKKKKRNGFFSFLFLRTKKIKRTVSRPEHS